MNANKTILKPEQLEEFKKRNLLIQNSVNQHKPFLFFSSSDCIAGNTFLYRRRDFYKISFLEGDYIVHYNDESIEVSGVSLSFFDPSIIYKVDEIKEKEVGGYFIFTEVYYDAFFNQSINKFPLFNQEFKPIFILNEDQKNVVKGLFSKIEQLNLSNYDLKDDLIRTFINELMHFANRLHPTSERNHQFTAKERLHTLFNELLDRQFPVDIAHPQQLRTASDYADSLHVHVNYLNRVMKEITGKSTRTLLQERMIKESIILLKHTSLNIGEVANAMGFKDMSNFNHFFRNMMNRTPSYYRK